VGQPLLHNGFNNLLLFMYSTVARQQQEIFQQIPNAQTLEICVTRVRPSQLTLHQVVLVTPLLDGLIKAPPQLLLPQATQ
jgi:hypothetical protein